MLEEIIRYIVKLKAQIINLEEENKKLREKNDINYSNYQNCLLALSEYDPDLKKYLENRK